MEERKRPASHDNVEIAPPLKRQATAKEEKPRKRDDAELPGGAELEQFKREAIYRRMLEFKREKNTIEGQLADASKLLGVHDDYIRRVDVYAHQLVDCIRLQKTHSISLEPYDPIPGDILASNDPEVFSKHLDERTDRLWKNLDAIIADGSASSASTGEASIQLEKCREMEKLALVEKEKAKQERDQMRQRLETATQRYMLAEKKLDRAKSSTVQKLEAQAIAGSRPDTQPANENRSTSEQTNGVSVDGEALARADEAKLLAEAATAKHKEQVAELAAENETLNSRLTALQSKQSSLTDEDYAGTDLFRHLRAQYEDVIKRINDLEAKNIELRKEAEQLQAERSAYKNQSEQEHQILLNDRDLQVAKLEADLARIRAARDELYAKVQTYETNEDQERASLEQLRKFLEVKDERIQSLESQVERLTTGQNVEAIDLGSLPEAELRQKYGTMEQQYNMLNQELQGLGQAYKKLQSTTSTKINNQSELEDRAKRANADKNKADQRYFATMKLKDTMSNEIRALRAQASKSSDLISGLRDAEQAAKALVQGLESQLAKANDMLEQATKQCSKAQGEIGSQGVLLTGLKGQIEELKSQLKSKDESIAEHRTSRRNHDVEIEGLQANIKERDKRIEASKKKGSSSDNETLEMLRTLAICTVCRNHFKDTVIKTCGHTMCHECVEERISSRSRKCPHCNRAFGRDDFMKITLS